MAGNFDISMSMSPPQDIEISKRVLLLGSKVSGWRTVDLTIRPLKVHWWKTASNSMKTTWENSLVGVVIYVLCFWLVGWLVEWLVLEHVNSSWIVLWYIEFYSFNLWFYTVQKFISTIILNRLMLLYFN